MSEVRKYTEAFISSAGNTIHRAWIGVLDLEVKVGVLSSGDLVLIDVSIARFHGGCAVEGSVQASGYLPVFTVVKHLLQRDACNAAEKKPQLVSLTVHNPSHSFNTGWSPPLNLL